MIWKGIFVAFAFLVFSATTLVAQLAPTITSSSPEESTVGSVYIYDVEADGTPAPTFILESAPDDMSIDAESGMINWISGAAGNYDVRVTASNIWGSDSQDFTISVIVKQEAPVITSTPILSAVVGQDYSYDVEATGDPVPTFKLSEAPEGMQIEDDSGVISWSPQSTGDFQVVVIASNDAGEATQVFTISVSDQQSAPVILSEPVTQATVGQDYSYQVITSGDPAPVISLAVAPEGMEIDQATGVISWTPQAAGTFNVTVVASNDAGEDTQTYSITVSAQLTVPSITTIPGLTATVNQLYKYDVRATGNPAPAYSLTTAPSGMTINASTGVVRWTPTAAGDFAVTVVATNTQGRDEQPFTVTVSEARVAPAITSTPVTEAVVQELYSYAVTASGNPAPDFNLSEAPEGMTIDPASGLISWTPAGPGSFSVVVEAANDLGADTQAYTVTVTEQMAAPAITSAPVTQTFLNQNYSYDVNAEGNPVPTYALLQSPAGMTIDGASGVISWMPAQSGSFNVSVQASNAQGSDRQDYVLTVSMNLAAPTITSSPVTQALAGLDYIYDVQAVGNPEPTFELSTYPEGMDIDAATGLINWTPDAPGSYNVVVDARNSQGSFTQSYTVVVGLMGSVPLLQLQSLELVSPNTIKLIALVNPNGSPTTVTFEYGEGNVSASKVTAVPQTIGGFSEVAVLAQVSGLEEGKTYLYRAVAENNVGRIISATESFTTYQTTYQVVADRSFAGSIESRSYRLHSLPGDVDLDVRETMTGTLHTDWGAYLDNGSPQDYFVAYDGTEKFHFKPGRGFWMLSKSNWVVPEQAVNTVSLDKNGIFQLRLQEGWNIIASPFNVSLPWALVRAATPSVSQTAKLWAFNGTFREAGILEPYQAYVYFNDAGEGAVLSMPYPGLWQGASKANPSTKHASKNAGTHSAASQLTFKATGMDSLQAVAEIRIDAYAKTSKDILDQYAPRDGFSPLNVGFKPSFEAPYGKLALDARPSVAEGEIFELVLDAPHGEAIELAVSGLEHFQDLNVVLVDPVTGQFIDLFDQPLLTVYANEDHNGHRVLIGPDHFVENLSKTILPDALLLQQNYPNPFANATTLSYSLPAAEHVELTVYDMLGREVQKLVSNVQPAGFHQMVWNGENGTGSVMPNGVYLLRMKTASGTTQIISMTKVR